MVNGLLKVHKNNGDKRPTEGREAKQKMDWKQQP